MSTLVKNSFHRGVHRPLPSQPSPQQKPLHNDGSATLILVLEVRGGGEEERLKSTLSSEGYHLKLLERHPPLASYAPLVAKERATAPHERPVDVGQLLTAIAGGDPRVAPARQADRIEFNELTIVRSRFEVLLHGRPLNLTVTEFKILWLLASSPNIVFSRKQIVDHCKGVDSLVGYRSVDVNVAGLRRKLETAGVLVQTVRGVGYRFGRTVDVALAGV